MARSLAMSAGFSKTIPLGPRAPTVRPISTLSTQTSESMPTSRHRRILAATSASVSRFSAWLMTAPAAPASRSASGSSRPMPRPGSTASTAGAVSVRSVAVAASLMSGTWGVRTNSAPVSRPTRSINSANARPSAPWVPGYTL